MNCDEWEEKSVEKLMEEGVLEKPIDGNHGNIHPKGEDFVDQGIPFIMASDIIDGNLDTKNCKFITEKQAKSLKKGFSVEGDVLLSHKATIGRTALVKNIETGFIMLTPQVTYYRIKNKEKLYNIYLKYYFDSPYFQEILTSWAGSGSTRAYLGIVAQQKLPILVPPIEKQKVIADILSSLDDKIDLDRQMNSTLEQIAQTLFKRWFIDFEFPDENGNPYKLSGGRMVDSELGEIPEGWEVKSLYDCAQYINGVAFKSADFSSNQEGLPIIKISELKNGITSQTEFTTKEFDPKYRITNGQVLFSWSGSPDTSIDIFLWTGGDGWLNQHTFRIVPYEKEKKEFIFLLLKNFKNSFIEIARNKQTTGLGHVTSKDLKNMFVAFPSKEIIKQFNEASGSIVDKIFCNSIESDNLSQIRDSLLPKLMSGKIRVQV